MSFQWHRYLEFAESVLSHVAEFPDSEAAYRSVASRAYYAAYCATRNLVKQRDRQEFHGNAHQQLQDYLLPHAHRPRKRLGNRLRQLYQLRLLADYEDTLHQPAIYLAQQAIKQAQLIEANLADIERKTSPS
ncbi:MAG: hypothetical protein R3A44_31260 [Caldilineaceae bacterium]